MLETIGVFTIGFFAGMGVLCYIALKISERKERKKCTGSQEQERHEEQEEHQIRQGSPVIINIVDGGPAALLPLHGHKAKVVNANVMLYCLVEGINELIAVPCQCVVPDKTIITPSDP